MYLYIYPYLHFSLAHPRALSLSLSCSLTLCLSFPLLSLSPFTRAQVSARAAIKAHKDQSAAVDNLQHALQLRSAPVLESALREPAVVQYTATNATIAGLVAQAKEAIEQIKREAVVQVRLVVCVHWFGG